MNIEKWEEELDEKFGNEIKKNSLLSDRILDFIWTRLISQKQKIREKVEGMNKVFDKSNKVKGRQRENVRGKITGYNQALSDILKELE